MDFTKIRLEILKEYPFLKNADIKIKKRFVASDGRVSNTFLIESGNDKFKKFIAKSCVYERETLLNEWTVLKLLQNKKMHTPKLLSVDTPPKRFILMEYIKGISATEAIRNGAVASEIFTQVGSLTGLINSVELSHFGNILTPSSISWNDYVLDKLNEKLPIIKSVVDPTFFNQVMDTIEQTKYVLISESKNKPVLLHHDIYLENFIINTTTNQLTLIDFGISYGGRPLFDLAKFFIWDLCKFPEQKENFFKGYTRHVPLPSDFTEIMKFYIIRECFGMIVFFHNLKEYKKRNDSINALKNIVNNEGILADLTSPPSCTDSQD